MLIHILAAHISNNSNNSKVMGKPHDFSVILKNRNMKKNQIYLLLSICYLAFSCKNTTTNTENTTTNKQQTAENPLKDKTVHLDDDAFGKIIEIRGKSLDLPALIETREPQMLIKNDFLIIVTPFVGNNLFKIFSLPDFKLISKFGMSGGGPNEFNIPDIVPTDEKDKLFYIYEYPIQRLSYVTNDFKLHRCKIKFPKGELSASSLRKIHVLSENNMLYVAMSANGKKIYSFKPDSVVPENELFDLALDETYNNWAAYNGRFVVNKETNSMVYAYVYFRELFFLTLDAKIKKHLIFKYTKPKPGNAVKMLSPDNIAYYWHIASFPTKIFVACENRTPIEADKESKKGNDFLNIEVYNWDGLPLYKYKLDHSGYFCVDEKRNKLYLLAIYAEEPFYVYDLPKK